MAKIDNVRRFRDKKESGVNWEAAEHGWAKYHDDGLVTLDPEVFFRKRRKKNERK